MKRKRSVKNTYEPDEQFYDIIDESNQLIITTSQTHTSSIPNFIDNPNTNSLTSNVDNPNTNSSTSNVDSSNTTNPDTNMSIETSSLQQHIDSRNLVSKVWLYAKKLDGGDQAACQLCDFTCSCHSHSTTTIRNHLISKHKKTELITKKLSIYSKSTIPEGFKKELHQLCYNAIIKDGRPFNDLNKPGIKALLNKLCPEYSPPHRNQVSRHLKISYNQHHALLKEELKKVYRLSVTLDFWSNRKGESFLCMTGHWIDKSFDSFNKVIDFSSFNTGHTAIEIANVLKEKLIILGVYEKLLCITCDGAPNLILACEYLNNDLIRIWCCAHRLHLVVINALGFWLPENILANDSNNRSSVNGTTTNITTSKFIDTVNGNEAMDVDWDSESSGESWSINESSFNDETNESTTSSSNNTAKEGEDSQESWSSIDDDLDETELSELINDSWTTNFEYNFDPLEQQISIFILLKKCRAFAKIMKKSSKISNFIRIEQKALQLKKGINRESVNSDCKSRWNSTYVLIDSLIDLKQPIIKLFSEKRSLHLRKDQINNLSSIEIDNENWDILSSLHYVLRAFFFGTKMMSGKKYPSIGIAYYTIEKIKYFCRCDDNNDEQIKLLKKLLLDKLYKYFYNDDEQLRYLQRIAYFDPTSHLMFNDKEIHQIELYIKKLIMDDVYPNDLSTDDNLTNSSSTSQSSSMSSITDTRLKLSTFDEFIAACGEEEPISLGNLKEKSKRIRINEELKFYRLAAQEFNIATKPAAASALRFWKIHKARLPLLSHLAMVFLTASATSVPSESAFSLSSYIARKERSRISGQNLAFSVFLKDKV